jgi:hypothetical protein
VVTNGESERQRVLYYDGVTTDVRFFADTAKLVHTGVSANVGTIFNHNVARECSCICHDNAVADQTVVRDVRLGHNQTIVADLRQHTATRGPTMNGDEFPNVVSLPDSRFGGFTLVLQILRSESDGDKRKDVRFLANESPSIDNAVRFEADTIRELHLVSDDAVRSDETAETDPST